MEMSIGTLARVGGVGVETVRFYQRRGLLEVPPRDGGIRRYSGDDLRRLRFIRNAQQAGFTLEEIRELIALDAGHDHARVRALAKARIDALDRRIAELGQARDRLLKLASQCEAGTMARCPILSAFEP